MGKGRGRDRQFQKAYILPVKEREAQQAAIVTRSGSPFMCCICGQAILGTSPSSWPYKFQLDRVVDEKGVPYTLYACAGRCTAIVVDAGQSGRWQALPASSPLRKLFEQAVEKRRRALDKGLKPEPTGRLEKPLPKAPDPSKEH